MKRLVLILLAMLMILGTFVSCGEEAVSTSEKGEKGGEGANADFDDKAYTEGLVFELSEDGTYYSMVDYTGKATKVVIPSTYNNVVVRLIGEGAFKEDNSIETIVLPDTINLDGTIDTGALRACKKLKNIIVRETQFEDRSFFSSFAPGHLKSCKDLKYNEYENGMYLGNESNPYLVFVKMKDLTASDIKIHDNTKFIAGRAFMDSALTEIAISEKILSVGEYAFADCKSLKSVTFPDSLSKISGGIFSRCSELSEFVFPANCKEIGISAFQGCSALTSVVIPDSVTAIGTDAFRECSSLESVTLPSSLEKMGISVFLSCKKLRYNEDGNGGFYLGNESNRYVALIDFETTKRGTYTIQSGTKVVVEAFRGADISGIIIPDSVCYIGYSAFESCELLKEVVIPSSVTFIGNSAFEWCEKLERVVIPDSVTSIEAEMFYNCHALKEIEIPDSVTYIGYAAFFRCKSLESIVIPGSVVKIEKNIFGECESLQKINCEAAQKPDTWDEDWRKDNNGNESGTVFFGYQG